MNERVIAAVAHDDDSALWCGGYLAAHPGTHVACCCIDVRKPERAAHFFESCRVLSAVPFVLAGEFAMWDLDVRPIVAFASTYDRIITHNELGEYGHPAHIKLHHAMKTLGKPMQVFNYGVTLGEPVDFATKEAAIACYRTENLSQFYRQFDLTREALIDL